MPTQMKTLAPVPAKEKVLAFCEEALLITGIGMGGLIGANIMQYDQSIGMAAPGPLLHGSYTAIAVGLSIGKIMPIAINYLANRSQLSKNVAPLMEHLEKACTPHTHKSSRLIGMAAGVAMTAGLATSLNLVSLPDHVKISSSLSNLGQTFLTASNTGDDEMNAQGKRASVDGTFSYIAPTTTMISPIPMPVMPLFA